MDAMLDTGSALKDEQRGQPAPDSKQLHGEVQPPQRIRTKLARPRLFVCIHGCRFGSWGEMRHSRVDDAAQVSGVCKPPRRAIIPPPRTSKVCSHASDPRVDGQCTR